MGLYEISQGKNATQVGQETGRNPQTVIEWVHRYKPRCTHGFGGADWATKVAGRADFFERQPTEVGLGSNSG